MSWVPRASASAAWSTEKHGRDVAYAGRYLLDPVLNAEAWLHTLHGEVCVGSDGARGRRRQRTQVGALGASAAVS